MEFPPDDEVVTSIILSLGLSPTDEEIETHILDMGRWTDPELEAIGIVLLAPRPCRAAVCGSQRPPVRADRSSSATRLPRRSRLPGISLPICRFR